MGRANSGISTQVDLGQHRRAAGVAPASSKASQQQPDDAAVAERKARRDAALDQLRAATRELASSEGWQKWLSARSRFHNYSLNNQLLILLQMPEATQVASFTTWKSLNRSVKKGEKSRIRILRPVLVKKAVIDAETGEEVEKRVPVDFRPAAVFDVSQTEGEPLAEPPIYPLTGDSHAEYLPKLEAYAKHLGYSFENEELQQGNGYCDTLRKRIVIGSHLSPNHAVKTAVHEIAHALGVGYQDFTREQAEVMVESVAYTVCGALGLDTGAYSQGYTLHWDRGDGDLKALTRFAGKVDEVASKIEDGLGLHVSGVGALDA